MKNIVLHFLIIILSLQLRCTNEFTEIAKLFTFSIAATTTYCILNDQISARICPEYFTEGFHKEQLEQLTTIFPSLTPMHQVKNPTMLGLFWGSVYSPFIGGLFGIPLILAARVGLKSKCTYKNLIAPTTTAFGCLAILSAFSGYHAYKNPDLWKQRFQDSAGETPQEKKQAWIVCEAAHEAGYYYGKFIPFALPGYVLYRRFSM